MTKIGRAINKRLSKRRVTRIVKKVETILNKKSRLRKKATIMKAKKRANRNKFA